MKSVIDAIIRIKNGYLASRESVEVRCSKTVKAVLEKLVAQKYITSFEMVTTGAKTTAVVQLGYVKGHPMMTDVKLISKPGQKQYFESKMIPKVLNGMGVAILTTTKGVLTGSEAKKAGVGGELLFTIW